MRHIYAGAIILQLLLILGYTYHTSRLIRASFAEQRLHALKERLRVQQERLEQRVIALERGSAVGAYARNKGMIPLRISQLQMLEDALFPAELS